MSDATPDTNLRYLVREAVEREFANQVAPLRNELQIAQGMIKQFNRDIAGMQTAIALDKQQLAQTVEDLSDLVRGNEKTGSTGLVKRVETIGSKLDALAVRLDAADDQRRTMLNYLKAGRWVAVVLLGLGALDNETIAAWIANLITFLR